MSLELQVEKLTKEVLSLKRTIGELKALLKVHNDAMIDLVTKQNEQMQKALIKNMTRSASKIYFPISTQEEMDQFETDLNETNKDEVVQLARPLLKDGGLAKNLDRIIALDLILEYNIQGVQNKRCLQKYQNLLDVLFLATSREGWNRTLFMHHLARAIRLAKSKYFKRAYESRKREQKLASSEAASAESSAKYDEKAHSIIRTKSDPLA